MELSKTKNRFYILVSASMMMLLLLGSWWLYLVFSLSNKLKDLNHPLLEGNLISMIKWEGITFLILLLVLTITLLYIYIQDHSKTKSLQAFFASLTHELKTPLASMKLQSQVIADLIDDAKLETKEKNKFKKYAQRLVNDSLRLEDQLDNHLQLSRIERSAQLNLRSIQVYPFLQREVKRYSKHIKINLDGFNQNTSIRADDFALQTIFRNLLENSIKHCDAEQKMVTIKSHLNESIHIEYFDNGSKFNGDINKLGELFYKHNSPHGTGIGMYLVKKLMNQMRGELKVLNEEKLSFSLLFQTGENKFE